MVSRRMRSWKTIHIPDLNSSCDGGLCARNEITKNVALYISGEILEILPADPSSKWAMLAGSKVATIMNFSSVVYIQ